MLQLIECYYFPLFFWLTVCNLLKTTKKTSKITTPFQRRRPGPATPHDTKDMDNFDSLKREATKLERQLEDKVSRYQQVSDLGVWLITITHFEKNSSLSHFF